MNEVLIEGERLRLRGATAADLNYILTLQFVPENSQFVVPFDKEYHRAIIDSDGAQKMDVIIEERETGQPVGYFMLRGLDSPCAEWTHVIIGRKRLGYGREAMKLLMKWTFEVRDFHRVWIDCKDYNKVALHLYESLGFVREGFLREILLTGDEYENLIVLGMLDSEYFSQQS